MKLFIGEHDFINYRCVGTETSTTTREIFDFELISAKDAKIWDFELANDLYLFNISGSGFSTV